MYRLIKSRRKIQQQNRFINNISNIISFKSTRNDRSASIIRQKEQHKQIKHIRTLHFQISKVYENHFIHCCCRNNNQHVLLWSSVLTLTNWY